MPCLLLFDLGFVPWNGGICSQNSVARAEGSLAMYILLSQMVPVLFKFVGQDWALQSDIPYFHRWNQCCLSLVVKDEQYIVWYILLLQMNSALVRVSSIGACYFYRCSIWNGICVYDFHIVSHLLCWSSKGRATNSPPHVLYMGISQLLACILGCNTSTQSTTNIEYIWWSEVSSTALCILLLQIVSVLINIGAIYTYVYLTVTGSFSWKAAC